MKNISLLILILLTFGCGKKIQSGDSSSPNGDEINPTLPPLVEHILEAGVNGDGNYYGDVYEHQNQSDCVKFPETLDEVSGVHDANSWLTVSIEGSIYVTCEYELNNNQYEIYDCYDKRQNSLGILPRGYIYSEDRVKFEIKGIETDSKRSVQFPVKLDNCGVEY